MNPYVLLLTGFYYFYIGLLFKIDQVPLLILDFNVAIVM